MSLKYDDHKFDWMSNIHNLYLVSKEAEALEPAIGPKLFRQYAVDVVMTGRILAPSRSITGLYTSLHDRTEALLSVLDFGFEKYGERDGWRRVENGRHRYSNALFRHLYSIDEGRFYQPEDLDDESGLPHWAHAVCNAYFLEEL